VSLRRKETHCGPRRRKDSQLRITKVIKPIHSELRRNGILCSTIFFNAAQYPLGARVSVAGVAEAAHGGAAGLRNDSALATAGVILGKPSDFAGAAVFYWIGFDDSFDISSVAEGESGEGGKCENERESRHSDGHAAACSSRGEGGCRLRVLGSGTRSSAGAPGVILLIYVRTPVAQSGFSSAGHHEEPVMKLCR